MHRHAIHPSSARRAATVFVVAAGLAACAEPDDELQFLDTSSEGCAAVGCDLGWPIALGTELDLTARVTGARPTRASLDRIMELEVTSSDDEVLAVVGSSASVFLPGVESWLSATAEGHAELTVGSREERHFSWVFGVWRAGGVGIFPSDPFTPATRAPQTGFDQRWTIPADVAFAFRVVPEDSSFDGEPMLGLFPSDVFEVRASGAAVVDVSVAADATNRHGFSVTAPAGQYELEVEVPDQGLAASILLVAE